MDENPQKGTGGDRRKSAQGTATALGIGLGLALGAAFGAAIDNLALGLGAGLAISCGLGSAALARSRTPRPPRPGAARRTGP